MAYIYLYIYIHILTFYLTFCLASIQTYYILSGIYSDILSGMLSGIISGIISDMQFTWGFTRYVIGTCCFMMLYGWFSPSGDDPFFLGVLISILVASLVFGS